MDEAKNSGQISLAAIKGSLVPITPFPMPLTTPPDTSMNLVMAGQMSSKNRFDLDDDSDGGFIRPEKIWRI